MDRLIVEQAARYARQFGLDAVTLAMFVPVTDEAILRKLSGEELIGKVKSQLLP